MGTSLAAKRWKRWARWSGSHYAQAMLPRALVVKSLRLFCSMLTTLRASWRLNAFAPKLRNMNSRQCAAIAGCLERLTTSKSESASPHFLMTRGTRFNLWKWLTRRSIARSAVAAIASAHIGHRSPKLNGRCDRDLDCPEQRISRYIFLGIFAVLSAPPW